MNSLHVFAALATAGFMAGSQAVLAQTVGCGSLPQANAAPAYTTGPGAALAASGGAPRGGGGGGRGFFGGTPSPEAEALQKAVDDNAPASQIKDLLAKYEASQKDKQAKLAAAQENLRAVLTTKQEAQATLFGLLQ